MTKDTEIEERFRGRMKRVAQALDMAFNGEGKGRSVCFVLLTAEFRTEGRCNYISNGERKDIVCMMKEMVARFEGQPEMKGSA